MQGEQQNTQSASASAITSPIAVPTVVVAADRVQTVTVD